MMNRECTSTFAGFKGKQMQKNPQLQPTHT